MTRSLHAADALELSLARSQNAGVADDLLAVVASLRAASNAIGPSGGLRARRGTLLAGVAPAVTRPRPFPLARRLQLALIAATFGLLSFASFVAAGAAISWLREVMPADPAPYAAPTAAAEGSDRRSPSPTPGPTPAAAVIPDEPSPAPGELDALDLPPGRMPADDDADDPEDDETDDDDPEDDEADDLNDAGSEPGD